MKPETKLGVLFLTAIAALAIPIVFYIYTFGIYISHVHTVWAEMGSAMSGIYGPLLAFLALGVLFVQLLLQREATKLQQETTKHMYDQTHIQAANDQIAFYLGKLDVACVAVDPFTGVTVGRRLDAEFGFPPDQDMRDPAAAVAARRFHEQHPQVFSAWMAYQSVVGGWQAVDGQPYKVTLSSAVDKANVTLSLAVCRALDHGVWCWSEGNLSGPYLFGRMPT